MDRPFSFQKKLHVMSKHKQILRIEELLYGLIVFFDEEITVYRGDFHIIVI